MTEKIPDRRGRTFHDLLRNAEPSTCRARKPRAATAHERPPMWPLLLLLIAMAFGGHAWATDIGNAWQEVRIRGTSPFPRDNLAATRGIDATSPSGYLFGGSVDHFKRGPTFFNSLFAWQITGPEDAPVITFTERAKDSTVRPTARAFPAIGAIRNGAQAQLYVFGGSKHDRSLAVTTAQDTFWRYDASTDQWSDLSALGGPSPRSGAVMIVWQDDLFVFGGVSRSKDGSVVPYATHDDLWRFDTQDMAWSMLSDHMGPKNKRMALGGVVEADGHKRLLIYGGEPINPSRSVFPLDQETWAWNIAEGDWTRGADGPARNMASIGVNADGVLVFGGDKEGGVSRCGAPFDQNVTNDLFLYDVEEDAWTEIAGIANIPPQAHCGRLDRGILLCLRGVQFRLPVGRGPGSDLEREGLSNQVLRVKPAR